MLFFVVTGLSSSFRGKSRLFPQEYLPRLHPREYMPQAFKFLSALPNSSPKLGSGEGPQVRCCRVPPLPYSKFPYCKAGANIYVLADKGSVSSKFFLFHHPSVFHISLHPSFSTRFVNSVFGFHSIGDYHLFIT